MNCFWYVSRNPLANIPALWTVICSENETDDRYKQATVGDINTSKPLMDIKVPIYLIGLIQGRYKWEKWNEQKGKSKETAQKEYIAVCEYLLVIADLVVG